MANEFVVAETEVTVHQTFGAAPDKDQSGREVWAVSSKTLVPGDSVALDSLPPYQQEAVKDGKVEGLKVVSESEAKKLGAEARAARAGAPSGALAVETRAVQHSDYLVPDTERAENAAKLAEEEAGDGVASDDEANPLVGHAKASAGVATSVEDVKSGEPAGANEDTGNNDSAKLAKAGAKEDGKDK